MEPKVRADSRFEGGLKLVLSLGRDILARRVPTLAVPLCDRLFKYAEVVAVKQSLPKC
jgi:hypothetical protein